MATIDADAHVVESEHTWDYMDPSDRKYRPVLVTPSDAREERPVRSILDIGSARSYWLIDGKIRASWKERPSPSQARASGERSVMSRPFSYV